MQTGSNARLTPPPINIAVIPIMEFPSATIMLFIIILKTLKIKPIIKIKPYCSTYLKLSFVAPKRLRSEVRNKSIPITSMVITPIPEIIAVLLYAFTFSYSFFPKSLAIQELAPLPKSIPTPMPTIVRGYTIDTAAV